jgi:hypothetical protein
MSKIYDEIMALPNNKEKVKHFIDLGLNPRYGLSAEITRLMVDLYVDASGDTSMAFRYSCGACLDTMFRKLKDFLAYDDNMGKTLNDWPKNEPIIEEVESKKKKSKKDDI